jgi:UDP-N-acetylglucosamine--N-acetylmuramyl-(pentapeptide) pyrophosphoryl-undecaprenol N-acetylglucosamine transferase
MPERGASPILLAAGGTGGHLFPAEALAVVLQQRGHRVALVTDRRVADGDWAAQFPGDVHSIIAGTVTGAGMLARFRGGLRLVRGVFEANGLLGRIDPQVVVGFGGYPTVPPVLSASFRKVPTIIHEANAVMGRANRFLAPRVTAIATGFPLADDAFGAKMHFTGNPVRKPVLHAAETPYHPPVPGGDLKLLVFGGSQGARVMSDVLPPAIRHLPEALRARLVITQQARDEDHRRVESIYAELGIRHDIQPFFTDLPQRMADAHLVIGRSGAMTVTELGVIGRPSILVPLPGALDQDQAKNGAVLEKAGGAIMLPQSAFTPVSLADILERKMSEPARLARMAAAARTIGFANASAKLADLIEDMISG